MQLTSLLADLERFSNSTKAQIPEMYFTCSKPAGWNLPFNKCFRKEIPAEGYSLKSGVYFITDMNEEVLYIGKATYNNFGREIYGKFNVARITDPVNDIPIFEKSPMAEYAPKQYEPALIAGDVKIFAVSIEPVNMSSLVEVYLQTFCERTGDCILPPLNKRIG